MVCGTVIVVAVSDPAVQMRRLRTRNPQLSMEDAEHRVQSQGDVREKAIQADARGRDAGVVVWNDGTVEQLEKEVGAVVRRLKERSPQWWAWLLLLVPLLAGALALWNLFRSRRLRWKRESK
jgi:dephospho-CoA kinase